MSNWWASFYALFVPKPAEGARAWVATVCVLAGVTIFGMVTAVWVRFGWTLDDVTEPFLLFTTFVVMIGWILVRVRAKEEENSNARNKLENRDDGDA